MAPVVAVLVVAAPVVAVPVVAAPLVDGAVVASAVAEGSRALTDGMMLEDGSWVGEVGCKVERAGGSATSVKR